MSHEFAFISLPKDDLIELHRAYLARWLMQERLRHEQGFEEAQFPPILGRLEQLLGITEDQAHELFHKTEDELWEHSWLSFTDEWAWHRARQDAAKELGPRHKQDDDPAFLAATEKLYDKHFERYAAELDMREEAAKKEKVKKNVGSSR